MASTSNIGAGKPQRSGAICYAERTSSLVLPTAPNTATPSGFTELGFIGEDGVSNDNSPESDKKKSWGGATVNTSQTEKPDTWKFSLIEVTNVEVLKMIYGKDNVTTDSSSHITTVKATTEETPAYAFVIDMIVNGKAKTIVIPNGKITEVGEISYKDDELVSYEVTIEAMPDPANTSEECTHYEYIQQPA